MPRLVLLLERNTRGAAGLGLESIEAAVMKRPRNLAGSFEEIDS
jgi:hypothetical protein